MKINHFLIKSQSKFIQKKKSFKYYDPIQTLSDDITSKTKLGFCLLINLMQDEVLEGHDVAPQNFFT